LSHNCLVLRGFQVLLVDEDARALEHVARGLEYCGAVVARRSYAWGARAVLDATRPSVLVTGLYGGDADAYSLIRRVRGLPHEHVRDLPAIAVTPLGATVDAERMLAEGFQASVSKPVRLSELCTAIIRVATRGALSRHTLASALRSRSSSS
jgi:two-component system CheB/CheR fusion protein